MQSLHMLTADLEHLLEDSPPTAPSAAPAANPSTATGKCPKGFHRYPPVTGKCVPRDSLRDAYRGHEPVAAMHREKSQQHAQHAQAAVAKGDYQKAAHHADKARRHMAAAQRHHKEFDAIGKILYPHKHDPAMTHAGVKSPSNPGHAMQFPAVNAPKTHKAFGGSAWGSTGAGSGPAPQIHPQHEPSTPGYHPFGAPAHATGHGSTQSMPAAPAPPPVSPSQHHPTKPLGHAPTEPVAKVPTGLGHAVGTALKHGAMAAVQHKANKTGSLGWHALSHALTHLMTPAQSGKTGEYGSASHGPEAHAPTHPSMPAAPAPSPEPKVPFQHVSPYAPTGVHTQAAPPKPKKKKPVAAPGPMSL